MRAYFFRICCLRARDDERVLQDCMKILHHFGVEILDPKEVICCGRPYREEKLQLAALKNLELFAQPYPILVPSDLCAETMQHYKDRFAGFEDFCDRVYDVGDFLLHKLKVELIDQGEPVRVKWCSYTPNSPKSSNLLHELKHVHVIESGLIKSRQDLERALREIEEVDYIISGDRSALVQINQLLQKTGRSIACMHLYEFLAQRMGLA